MYGALNYAATSVHATHVDCLVLGQPMNTIEKMGPLLERKFQGQHLIANGRQITIDQCKVFPQPLGSYMSYLSASDHKSKMPCALVIDPGYGTVDWFVCEGMKAVLHKSDAVPLGVSAILSKVAKTIIKDKYAEMPEHVLVRAIDESLVSEQPLMLYGAQFDYAPFMGHGLQVAHDAAQAIRNAIGIGHEIDVIVITGGGGPLYEEAIKKAFPRHPVVLLEQPAYANVRGFHILGEQIARSMSMAKGM